jgi:CubicO group peptidase (beta-lactamase class C family)
MSFVEYVQTNLFLPSNMQTAFFAKKYPYTIEKFVASPFDQELQPDNYEFAVESLLLNVTAKDLYKWLKAIHSGAIVSTDGLNTLSESAGSQAYLGNVNWKNGSIIEHHHHGSSGNFEATVRYYKDKELYIVILTNQKNGNVSKIADKLIDLVEQTTSAEIGN